MGPGDGGGNDDAILRYIGKRIEAGSRAGFWENGFLKVVWAGNRGIPLIS